VEKERGKHQETELNLRGNHNILKAQKVQLSLKHFIYLDISTPQGTLSHNSILLPL